MRNNKTLNDLEFEAVKKLKQAIVNIHDYDYNAAESAISEALEYLYKINKAIVITPFDGQKSVVGK